MPDPRQYVRPGQKLQIAASQINALNDMMRVKTGFRGGPQTAPEPAQNIVLVRNDTAVNVPVGGALQIDLTGSNFAGGTLDGNNEASTLLKAMFQSHVYRGSLPTLSGQIAVALEPIPSEKVGRMAIGGSVFFRLRRGNSLHGYAGPRPGDCTQLQTAGCGPIRIIYSDGGAGDGKNAFGVF